MAHLNTFFIQYEVTGSGEGSEDYEKGLATIIVFARDETEARARASRYVAKQGFAIQSFQRIHLLTNQHRDMLNPILANLLSRAELYGIAYIFDRYYQPTPPQ
ncbi:MAG: hypothetical protein D6B25_14865 [Desulfobulbaceae bacterium]|nr:MAG: hypothetical protein D6B25_14865 [Desulfobulbaceae bacterium]